MLSLNFALVQSLHEDRYAYRQNMTDVVVQHLPSNRQVRIKCRDFIKRISIYKDRLAVQLPDRINIWELHRGGGGGGGE